MLPAAVAKIHAAHRDGKNEVEIWGDGNARREFIYAKDVADGIWTAANHFEHLPNVMNLGIGHDLSINAYYRVAAEVIGWKGTFVHNLDRLVGMKQKIVDNTIFSFIPENLKLALRLSHKARIYEISPYQSKERAPSMIIEQILITNVFHQSRSTFMSSHFHNFI